MPAISPVTSFFSSPFIRKAQNGTSPTRPSIGGVAVRPTISMVALLNSSMLSPEDRRRLDKIFKEAVKDPPTVYGLKFGSGRGDNLPNVIHRPRPDIDYICVARRAAAIDTMVRKETTIGKAICSTPIGFLANRMISDEDAPPSPITVDTSDEPTSPHKIVRRTWGFVRGCQEIRLGVEQSSENIAACTEELSTALSASVFTFDKVMAVICVIFSLWNMGKAFWSTIFWMTIFVFGLLLPFSKYASTMKSRVESNPGQGFHCCKPQYE
jgi:hypothetical protein